MQTAFTLGDVSFEDIGAVEIVGGGTRMPIVQSAIHEALTITHQLGAKFDDASVALGAALVASKVNDSSTAIEKDAIRWVETPVVLQAVGIGEDGVGLTSENVEAARLSELAMQVSVD